MNASANSLIRLRRRSAYTPLIVGIGNPLRGDDGLGQALVEQLGQSSNLDCNVLAVHQLTPELAEQMAKADFVVLIDASREGKPGEVRVHQLPFPTPPQRSGALGPHHMRPEELIYLTAATYGYCPPVTIISVTGTQFDLDEQLSEPVIQSLSHVNTILSQMLVSGKGEENHDAFNDARARI
jgi:hydrogenase maturation protease